MLSIRIEFYPLDWYSSNFNFSPAKIVLYNRMCMFKVFASKRQKLKKNAIFLKKILQRLRHM